MDWNNNSIVIYSNFPFHVEDWSPLSVNKGIGGSEEAGETHLIFFDKM